MFVKIAFVAFTVLVAMSGANSTPAKFSVNYNFDTIPVNPLVITGQIGEYDLLYFQNIDAINESTTVATGLQPHTKPNTAVFTLNTMLNGLPFQISSQYYESSITSFRAISWWYGCAVASGETTVGVPVSCNITATGYSSSGSRLAQQTFTFKGDATSTKLNFGLFSKAFTGVQRLVLDVSNKATTTAVIDNFIAELTQGGNVYY